MTEKINKYQNELGRIYLMIAERALLISISPNEASKNKPLLTPLPSFEPDPTERPLAPLESMAPPPPPPEPAPWVSTAKEWREWIIKRDAFENFKDAKEKAINYANENDLRGVPFS